MMPLSWIVKNKYFLVILFAAGGLGFAAGASETAKTEVHKTEVKKGNITTTAPAALSGNTISATPRLIRSQPQTEVFFRDLNTSYVIPKDSGHNKVFEAVTKAIKNNSKISLKVEPRSRQILGLAEDEPNDSGAHSLAPVQDVEKDGVKK